MERNRNRLNKKGAVPIIFWIVGTILGVFIANQLGFFAVFIPDIGQPIGTDSLVNPIYYGEAISNYNFQCNFVDDVIFRSTFSHSQSSRPTEGEIAIDEGGDSLVGFIYKDKSSRSNTRELTCEGELGSSILTLSGGLKVIKNSDTRYYICQQQDQYHIYFSWFDKNTGSLSVSKNTGNGGYEVIKKNSRAIKGDQKYACREGNVVLQQCNSFLSEYVVQQTCELGCEYLSNQQTPEGGTSAAIKCIGKYIPNKNLCIDSNNDGKKDRLYSTNSDGQQITPNQCGAFCDNGKCVDCIDGNTRCAQNFNTNTDREICINGKWQEDNNPGSTCIGSQKCVESNNKASCESNFINGQERCNGKQPEKYDGTSQTWKSNGESCDLSCQFDGSKTSCQKQCDPIGYHCIGGYLEECLNTDIDNEIKKIGACLSGQCNDDKNQCLSIQNRKSGDRYCYNGDIWVAKSSGDIKDLGGGITGERVQDCINSCQLDKDNQPFCTLAIACEDKSGQSICYDNFNRKTCSEDMQTYTQEENCASVQGGYCTTENNAGICKQPSPECSGSEVCTESGIIRSCSNGKVGDIITECNSLGCSVNNNGVAQCKNECNQEDLLKCSNGDSFKCTKDKNSRDQLVLQFQTKCGIDGCNIQSGQCISTGTPNSFICRGEALHSTDSQGFPSINPIKICSSESLRNGLQPYCSNGNSDCKVCEENQYICSSSELSQCSNPFSGEKKNIQICEAGCSKINNNYYCDHLSSIISANQNFLIGEDLLITGSLTGSKSNKGIMTTINARLEGDGISLTKSVSSSSNGKFDINFEKRPLGSYTIFIDVPEFKKQFIVNSKVTNDFIIGIAGDAVLTKIPGSIPSVFLEIKGGTGEPDDIIEFDVPSEISFINVKKEEISGRWKLEIDGDNKIYNIKLAAVDEEVILDTQNISLEIRKPKLTITSNLPNSAKMGELLFDVSINGPTKNKISEGIKPDTIIATISKSPAQTIDLLEIGSGTYTVKRSLSEIGTYTLNVEATKEGYEQATFSKQIQISESGEELPQSEISKKSGSIAQEDLEDTSKLSVNNNLLILIVIGILFFIFFRKK